VPSSNEVPILIDQRA